MQTEKRKRIPNRRHPKGHDCSPAKLQAWMIGSTFVLAVLIGVATFFNLVRPPQSFSTPELAAKFTSLAPYSIAKKDLNSDRSPASVATSLAGAFDSSSKEISLGAQRDQSTELTIACADYGSSAQKVEAKFSHVRLNGSACIESPKSKRKSKVEIVSSEIRNDSNGFTATVFYTQSNKFTTDYIGLQTGLNKIHVQHTYSNGAHEEHEYVVERL